MKLSLRHRAICLGVLLVVSPFHLPIASARKLPRWVAPADAPASEPSPLPAEKPPTINPDAAPSASLQPLLASHLDKVLAPLGTPAFAQSELLAGIKATYAQGMAAAPDARKPAYRLATAVCDAMIGAIGERQQFVTAMNKSYEMRRSEAIQPRGGGKAVKQSDRDEAYFYDGQKNNWLQNAASLRKAVAVLCQRERNAETQAGEWTMPTPAPPAADAAPALPPEDPVVGQWMLEDAHPVTFGTDKSIKGERDGTWQYTCTTNAGRNYELHIGHQGWVDYMVLSSDGKFLDGKTKKGKHVVAHRS